MIDGKLSDAFTRAWPAALPCGYGPYRGIVTAVHDGDTCTVVLSPGFDAYPEIDVRIFGINAPELHGKTKAEGEAARDFLRSILPPGSPVRVTTLPATSGEQTRSFVRYVARVETGGSVHFATPPDDVAAMMVGAGHAIWVDRNMRPTAGPPPFGE